MQRRLKNLFTRKRKPLSRLKKSHEDEVAAKKERFCESLQQFVQNLYEVFEHVVDQVKEFCPDVPFPI